MGSEDATAQKKQHAPLAHASAAVSPELVLRRRGIPMVSAVEFSEAEMDHDSQFDAGSECRC